MKGLMWIAAALLSCSCYSLKQAYHFTSLYASRVETSEVKSAKAPYPKVVKDKLRQLEEILAYAKEQGLAVEGAYQSYIHTGKPSVSYLVQASPPYQLELKTWWFPFVGSVPYLGFFEESERDAEYLLLSAKYDVSKSYVGAFSSLGWFEDPIYTSMLLRPHSSMAQLFFHELVHRSFWWPDNAPFNEQLAEFIGNSILQSYLKDAARYQDLAKWLERREDKALYSEWLKNLRKDLADLYASGKPIEQMKVSKEEVIRLYLGVKFPDFQSAGYKSLRRKDWNNASIMGASLYSPDLSRFSKAYQCFSPFKAGDFLKALQEKEENFKNGYQALDSFCDHEGEDSV